MIRLKLHNNIGISVEVEGELYTEPGTLKIECLHRGRFRKKIEVVSFIQGSSLTEDSSSTEYIRRFRGIWESSTQVSDYAVEPWDLRVSILDQEGNAFYTVEYPKYFSFEFPLEGLELSTNLNIAVSSQPTPEVPEGVKATAVGFNPEGLGIQATTVQEAIVELARKTAYVGE